VWRSIKRTRSCARACYGRSLYEHATNRRPGSAAAAISLALLLSQSPLAHVQAPEPLGRLLGTWEGTLTIVSGSQLKASYVFRADPDARPCSISATFAARDENTVTAEGFNCRIEDSLVTFDLKNRGKGPVDGTTTYYQLTLDGGTLRGTSGNLDLKTTVQVDVKRVDPGASR